MPRRRRTYRAGVFAKWWRPIEVGIAVLFAFGAGWCSCWWFWVR